MNTVRIDNEDGTPIYSGSMSVPVTISLDVDVDADRCGELHASVTQEEWKHAKESALEKAIEKAKERWAGE